MVNIIELILNNWFILVIIYIGISTFMKTRRGGTEQQPDQQSRPRPARPVRGGMPPFGGDGPGSGWPKRQQERQEPKAVSPAEPKAVVSQENREVSAPIPAQRSRAIPQTLQTPASALQRPAVQSNRPATSSFQPTPDDLARGVLWAEILGPPRAKRPYRR